MAIHLKQKNRKLMANNEIFTLDNESNFRMIVRRTQESVSTELDGETVILDIASGIYSGLDPVGTYIWNKLEQPLSVGFLHDAVLSQYDVIEEKCTADLLNFLKDLADNGLIVIADETSD